MKRTILGLCCLTLFSMSLFVGCSKPAEKPAADTTEPAATDTDTTPADETTEGETPAAPEAPADETPAE